MGYVIRTVVTALAVWLSTFLISGIHVGDDSTSTTKKIVTVLVVALIFGIVNAVLRPIIKVVGCWAYVLTLGLVALVVNGALFELTGWIAGKLDLPFTIDNFWPSAILGALFVAIVSGILNWIIDDKGKRKAVRSAPTRKPDRPSVRY